MRQFWNGLLRALGRGLAPIHRPVTRRLDERMNRLVDARLSAELEERLVPTLSAALETTAQTVGRLDDLIARTDRSHLETGQALHALLGEVLRLRAQVEHLRQFVPCPGADLDAEPDPSDDLPLEEPEDACDPFAPEPEQERARVG